MISGIALTTGFHPLSLGIQPQSDGQVWVGSDIRIECWIAENVYSVAARKAEAEASNQSNAFASEKTKADKVDKAIRGACQKHTIKREQGIPTKIWQLRCTGGLRLVIVVEHQNIGTALKWLGENATDTIIVMVISSFLPCIWIKGHVLTWC